jgi:hypothetical protein
MRPKEAMEEMLALLERYPTNEGLVAECPQGPGLKKSAARR